MFCKLGIPATFSPTPEKKTREICRAKTLPELVPKQQIHRTAPAPAANGVQVIMDTTTLTDGAHVLTSLSRWSNAPPLAAEHAVEQ